MIRLSESAEREVQRLVANAPVPASSFLRVRVTTGGCSGLTYDVRLDDKKAEGDQEFTQNQARIVCDEKSLPYLKGMTIDFSHALVGGGFRFLNPNAAGSCGCGTSFSV